jgi:hypothetical protein
MLVLLIALSFLIIIGGIFLLDKSEKNIEANTVVDYGKIVASVGNFFVTDKHFIVVSRAQRAIPVINIKTDPLTVGDRLSGQGIEVTLELLGILGNNKVAVESVTLYTNEYIVLKLMNPTIVIINENHNTAELASSLQSMLSVFTIEGRMPKEIDFRFDKPVVRY